MGSLRDIGCEKILAVMMGLLLAIMLCAVVLLAMQFVLLQRIPIGATTEDILEKMQANQERLLHNLESNQRILLGLEVREQNNE